MNRIVFDFIDHKDKDGRDMRLQRNPEPANFGMNIANIASDSTAIQLSVATVIHEI